MINHNIEYLINYSRIVEDKDYYLWMKLAKDNDVIINFKNEEAREKWIETIENDLRKFGTKEEILLKQLHWRPIWEC